MFQARENERLIEEEFESRKKEGQVVLPFKMQQVAGV
jgi:hypothetical protein